MRNLPVAGDIPFISVTFVLITKMLLNLSFCLSKSTAGIRVAPTAMSMDRVCGLSPKRVALGSTSRFDQALGGVHAMSTITTAIRKIKQNQFRLIFGEKF